ncbi:MAG TPA: ribonuclease HII, partial [Ignisphaera sp.]|nr:ribonuclease HII [Ignisphaera sp.]
MEYNRIIIGIDEAGRGPLIGDMFIALVAIRSHVIEKLKVLGVKDSKKLSPDQRQKLFPFIIESSELVLVTRAVPLEIDEKNLNDLFIDKVCKCIVNAYSRLRSIDTIYIDSAGNPEKLKEKIRKCLILRGIHANLIVEHRADAKYLVVGAASIVAKYLRDTHIDMLKRTYGDFGSGYPSDMRTIEWLKTYY